MQFLIDLLRCPYCAGRFAPQGEVEAAGYGSLSCACNAFPVVAGIPILKADAKTADVLKLIGSRRTEEALLRCIEPDSPALAPSWMKRAFPTDLQGPLRRAAHRWNANRWRERWRTFLRNMDDRTLAWDVLAEYLSPHPDASIYYGARYYLPRYLSGLSLLTILPKCGLPLIDIGCGAGHTCWSHMQRNPGSLAIGIDGLFFGLFVAKQWIAPEASFVCAELEHGLPFASGVFGAAFCSDTLHYLRAKLLAVSEARRVVQQSGAVIFADTINAQVRAPRAGLPLAPEAYRSLMSGAPYRCISSMDALSAYSERRGPCLKVSTKPEDLVSARFLNFISGDESLFQDFGAFDDWPHASGKLQLSRFYEPTPGVEPDSVILKRKLPSPSFTERNPGCEVYPETVPTTVQALRDIRGNRRTAEVNRLIGSLLVYGTPSRFDRHPTLDAFLTERAATPGIAADDAVEAAVQEATKV